MFVRCFLILCMALNIGSFSGMAAAAARAPAAASSGTVEDEGEGTFEVPKSAFMQFPDCYVSDSRGTLFVMDKETFHCDIMYRGKRPRPTVHEFFRFLPKTLKFTVNRRLLNTYVYSTMIPEGRVDIYLEPTPPGFIGV